MVVESCRHNDQADAAVKHLCQEIDGAQAKEEGNPDKKPYQVSCRGFLFWFTPNRRSFTLREILLSAVFTVPALQFDIPLPYRSVPLSCCKSNSPLFCTARSSLLFSSKNLHPQGVVFFRKTLQCKAAFLFSGSMKVIRRFGGNELKKCWK